MKYSSVKTENSWQSKNYFFLKCYVRLKVKKHKLQLPPFLFFLISMYGKVNWSLLMTTYSILELKCIVFMIAWIRVWAEYFLQCGVNFAGCQSYDYRASLLCL